MARTTRKQFGDFPDRLPLHLSPADVTDEAYSRFEPQESDFTSEKRAPKIDLLAPYLPIADSDMERRSTAGSPSFSKKELRAGYRRLG